MSKVVYELYNCQDGVTRACEVVNGEIVDPSFESTFKKSKKEEKKKEKPKVNIQDRIREQVEDYIDWN